MKTRRNRTESIGVMVSLIAAFAWVGPAFAVDILDDPVQIDERVAQLDQTSNSLCWELNRYHQKQPNYLETYQAAKEIWSQSEQLRAALRAGPVETEDLIRRLNEINTLFGQVEETTSKWGPGDLTLVPMTTQPIQQTVVQPGVGVEIPFIGVRVGGPRTVVVEDGVQPVERKRLHPNSHGSKRSLQRELASVKLALSYLEEDAGMAAPLNPSQTSATTETSVVPPRPDPTLSNSQKVVPLATKKP